jgi:tryptophanase
MFQGQTVALASGGGLLCCKQSTQKLTCCWCYCCSELCSGKKEALANVGGLLCCNDDALHEQLRNLTIVVEGYPTYGGLACR